MYIIKFCRAPSKLWFGVIEYNGGHVFSTGKTMDDLVKHAKHAMWKYGVPAAQIILDTKQHDTYEFEMLYRVFINPKTYGKYFKAKNAPTFVEPAEPVTETPKTTTHKVKERPSFVANTYITEEKNGVLIVYGLQEVARYPLHTSKQAAVPMISLTEEPVCTDVDESQEENL